MVIGVVGSGIMGAGIAQIAAQAGNKVLLYDLNLQALDRAKEQVKSALQHLVTKGKFSQNDADTIYQSIDWTTENMDLETCDWIIEAIVEDLDVKKTLFCDLEKIVSENCILASNTSSLSITAIAAACKRPERVVGIHFFNPVPMMQLVEVIPALQTNKEILTPILLELTKWGKTPVLAKDTPGFIVNRIARPFYSEALRIVDEGIASIEEVDNAMKVLGNFKMGPFELMDFIGHDVNFRVTQSMYTSCYYEPRYKPSFYQKALFDAGYFGKKSGKGFYTYPREIDQTAKYDAEKQQRIFYRILVMLINEAADALHWNIATQENIDLAMTKGVNYPKGLLCWADALGIDFCVKQLDELYAYYHEERYRCSPILRQKKESKFYVS
jgi:3-hydroxybutyryl-CoA dehydrogenase